MIRKHIKFMEPALDLFNTSPALPDVFARWFASRGWQPRAHQLELLAKAKAGRSTVKKMRGRIDDD